MLRRKDETMAIHGPVGLFEALTAAGRKGITLQRYKGLGEMNPEQLWETTLDVNARSLLQVKIKEVDEASVLFDQLMGDVVEPRRQFIQDNALTRDASTPRYRSRHQPRADRQADGHGADEQHQENAEQNFGDGRRCRGDAGKAEQAGDDGDQHKNDGPSQHGCALRAVCLP